MKKLGDFLRSSRLQQGIDIETAAEETSIKPVYLRAIEDENYDLIPGEIYQRHYFKTYLEYLGHEDLYYKLIREQPTPAQPAESMVRKPTEEGWDTSRYVRVAMRVGLLLIALVVIISLASVALGRIFGDDDKPATPSKNKVEELDIDFPWPQDPVETAITDALGPPADLGDVDGKINSALDTHTVRIETMEECWVQASGPKGVIYQGSMQEGDIRSFGPEKYFIITLGRPESVHIYFDDVHIYGGDLGQPPAMTISLPADISVDLKKLINSIDDVSGSN